jgi:hypothetical protein
MSIDAHLLGDAKHHRARLAALVARRSAAVPVTEASASPFGTVIEFRDGKISRSHSYLDHGEVLWAAGLAEYTGVRCRCPVTTASWAKRSSQPTRGGATAKDDVRSSVAPAAARSLLVKAGVEPRPAPCAPTSSIGERL